MKKSAAPNVRQWIKVILHLRLDLENYKEIVRRYIVEFEDNFKIKHLYYARYTGLENSTVEISALTPADWRAIREFFEKLAGITHVEVLERDSGSLAHAYAYQAVKRIKPYEPDLADDNDFADVIHWMANMRGMDYIREARLYSYRALIELHKLAVESEKNIQAMRNFNRRARTTQVASDLIERLNLSGKRPKGDKAVGPAPKPTRKLLVRVASDRVPAVRRKKSSGSARR